MRVLIILFLVFLSYCSAVAQNTSKEFLTCKVDSLQGLINENLELIDSIDKKNVFLQKEQSNYQNKLDEINIENLIGTYYICVTGTNLYKEPNSWRVTLSPISRGDRVKVTEVLDGQYKVYFKGLYGYVFKSGFIREEAYIEELKEKEELEIIYEQQRLLRLEKAEKQIKIEKQKEKEQEQILLQKQKVAKEKRKKEIIEKYGSYNGTKILNNKIWLGMTDEMARESWGRPNDNNRSVGSWGVHEQWVYSSANLYFENGILTSWQD